VFKIYMIKLMPTDEVVYVGRTRYPHERMRQHQANLFRDLKIPIKMEIIESCPEKYSARERERFWIRQFLKSGHKLINRHVKINPCPIHKDAVLKAVSA